jgi:DnaJ-class molecular chaperone
MTPDPFSSPQSPYDPLSAFFARLGIRVRGIYHCSTFDSKGRLLTRTEFAVAKEGVCGDCHGSGTVILLTSCKDCPHCLGTGKRIIADDACDVTSYG